MEQQADYIRRIEIKGLWGRFNIQWDLRPDVNILSGINVVGKTTILNRSVGYLEQLSGDIQLSGEMKSDAKNGVDRKSTRLNSSHASKSRMPSSA